MNFTAKLKLTSTQTLLTGVTHRKIEGDIISYRHRLTTMIIAVRATMYSINIKQDRLNTQLGIRLEDDEKYGSTYCRTS